MELGKVENIELKRENQDSLTTCQRGASDLVLRHRANIWWGSFPRLEEAGFVAACSCRLHGESELVPGTLNLALHVGDNREMVLRNRSRYGRALGVEANSFTTCAQVHGNRVVVVDKELIGKGALAYEDTIQDTDGLITNIAGVPLLLFYADCVPVLLADPVTGAYGLVHAGWRGTVGEIALRAIELMQKTFGCRPENLLGAVGPAIGPCCYEVDDFVRDQAPGYEEFFEPKGEGKYWLDLWGLNRQQLLKAGLKPENISMAATCTNDNKELFCSYRAEQGKTGRMGVCLCRKA